MLNSYYRYMGLELYERPRERLQRRGAKTLTLVELLQVVIGSGDAKTSGARIAKNIAAQLSQRNGKITFDELTRQPGVGVAKAAVVLASIELGVRLQITATISQAGVDYASLRGAPKATMVATYYDSKGALVLSSDYDVSKKTHISLATRSVFSKAVESDTRSIQIGLGSKFENTKDISTNILDLLHQLYTTAEYLQIALTSITLINKDGERHIKRADLP